MGPHCFGLCRQYKEVAGETLRNDRLPISVHNCTSEREVPRKHIRLDQEQPSRETIRHGGRMRIRINTYPSGVNLPNRIPINGIKDVVEVNQAPGGYVIALPVPMTPTWG